MNPTVIILRGLPGSGKSTYANARTNQIVFSADKFFEGKDGKFIFDPKRIGDAHAWCFRTFLLTLVDWHKLKEDYQYQHNFLVVDNTNISAYEIAPYIQAANAFGYTHEICTFWCDPSEAFYRNIHGVPAEVIFGMYQKMLEEKLPSFWNHKIALPNSLKR